MRPADPMLADETMVTRTTDRDKQPTLEVPFPEAVEAPPPMPGEANVGGSTRPAAKAAGAVAVANAPSRTREALGNVVRKTLTNVRALPAWRRRVPPAIFVGIVTLLVAGLIATVVSIRSKVPPPPVIDTTAEARRLREKQLREDANALLRQGRVSDAYAKYEELQRLAPKSPFVTTMLQKLGAIRQQEEISKAQLAQAKTKFDEGVALLAQKKYPDAIERLQESFSLNPNSEETAEYLKLAQSEQQKAEAAKQTRGRTTSTKTAATTTTTAGHNGGQGGDGGTQTAGTQSAQSQLNTVFTHPFTDGRIVVRAGADIVANEQLFDEKPARLFRRATRAPRNINVTHALPSKNADVQVWVTVPASGIQEHKVIPAVRFQSGQVHRLVVQYNAATRAFTYEVN